MNYIYGILAGLIRGLGEFLPISDSGHLLILKKLAVLPENGVPEALLHFAVLAAALILFHKTVWRMLTGFCSMLAGAFTGTFKWRKASRYQMMAVYVLVATLPLIAVEVVRSYYDFTAKWGGSLVFAGGMLLVTAGLIYIGTHSLCRNWTVQDMKPGHALKLGLFQAVSVLPGLSRSGTALSMARNMGFGPEAALEFSFMLSLPALLVSGVADASSLAAMEASQWGVYAAAALAAMAAAIGAVCLAKWLIKKERYGIFSIYCGLAGIAALVLNFV